MSGGRAWIEEETETDRDGRVWLTGCFEVHVECADGSWRERSMLGWEAAVSYTRGLADLVYVHSFDDDSRYTLFGTDPAGDSPPLTREAEALLATGRRRPAADRWLDRTDADPPIAWEIVVDLNPDLVNDATVEAADRVAASVSRCLEGLGLDTIGITKQGLLDFHHRIRAHAEEEPAEGEGELKGWTWFGDMDVHVSARGEAPTYRSLANRVAWAVKKTLNAVNHRMPHRDYERDERAAWDARVRVHPPSYRPPFGSSYRGVGTVDVPPDWT